MQGALEVSHLDTERERAGSLQASNLIPAGNGDSIQYQVIVPVFNNGIAVLGELMKLVPVSEERIAAVHVNARSDEGAVVLKLSGEPQEVVTISFASTIGRGEELKVDSLQCEVGAAGTVAMHYPSKKCTV